MKSGKNEKCARRIHMSTLGFFYLAGSLSLSLSLSLSRSCSFHVTGISKREKRILKKQKIRFVSFLKVLLFI